MIKAMPYDAQTRSARQGCQERLSHWPGHAEGSVWADF